MEVKYYFASGITPSGYYEGYFAAPNKSTVRNAINSRVSPKGNRVDIENIEEIGMRRCLDRLSIHPSMGREISEDARGSIERTGIYILRETEG
jgi:hypothetical protein